MLELIPVLLALALFAFIGITAAILKAYMCPKLSILWAIPGFYVFATTIILIENYLFHKASRQEILSWDWILNILIYFFFCHTAIGLPFFIWLGIRLSTLRLQRRTRELSTGT